MMVLEEHEEHEEYESRVGQRGKKLSRVIVCQWIMLPTNKEAFSAVLNQKSTKHFGWLVGPYGFCLHFCVPLFNLQRFHSNKHAFGV